MTEDRITEVLQAYPEVRFALLFGSRAGGSARPDSDWDVAVYLDPSLSKQERFGLRLRLTGDLSGPGCDVDVVVLNDAPPLLAHRALQGRRLFVRDEVAWVRFFVRTLSDVEDEAHYLDVHRRARRQRIAEGRFGRP